MMLDFMKGIFKIKDKKQVHKIGLHINCINGAEEIEFNESCLTDNQKMAIALGMNKLEDFKLPKEKISKEYSSGMKMKLKIAVALAHHPKLSI